MAAPNGSSGVPPETPQELLADSIKLIGSTTVCGTFYGLMTVLACACVQTFLSRTSRARRTRGRLVFLVGYVGLLWLGGTLYVVGLARSIQDAYVDLRLKIPSPAAWNDFQLPEAILADAAYSVSTCLADGLMVWRFRTMWYDSRLYWLLMPFPILLYLAVAVLSFVSVVTCSLPGHNFYSKLAYKTTIPGFVTSVVLNFYTTSLMAGRLYTFRRRFIRDIGGATLHTKQYTNIAGMLVESCALFTMTSLIFIGFYLSGHPAEFVMIAILSQMQIIAPLLVMLRISRGIAWEATTASTLHARSRHDVVELGDRRRRRETGDEEDENPSALSSLKFARHDDVDGEGGPIKAQELHPGEADV
ncbi:hypothetical protein CONPUDRAFT_166889 [Coniophora puteana RWD-64-598 SS2]|uniref:Family A G protein-coupled receptor-like protein n=1 Tax=Coniophora puteana (strain RWD-64-598) TaxID=741705 RepID=A0A5M3MJ90_CONPW|nr:uncharacterized protein CONPUDRAFT_166889 [Coniophora puteana RWD-64-598 SS2]EIW79057.1 hypothetical protein CONPUDRAFT_166889 [Coniophora puteana RWD-64-598 SS2]